MVAQLCRYFHQHQCTGCTKLHEPYQAQLAWKEALVRERLAPVLARGAVLKPIVGSPQELAYRSSVKLCLHADREGRQAVGLYRFGTKDVAHIPGCPAQTREINQLADLLFGGRRRPPAPFYNHRSRVFQRGKLKVLVVRSSPVAQGVILSHTGVSREALVHWLKQAGLADLCAYESRLTPQDGDLPVGRHVAHLSGPAHFAFPLAGRVFQLSPTAFFQANFALSDALIAAATAFEQNGDRLLDLYGGFGAYSFAAAQRFRHFTVVDGNAAAVDAARRTAQAEGLTQLSAVAGYCEAFLEDVLTPDEARQVTHVLVNPPRAGLSRRVQVELAPRRLPALRELHYVSCSPQTLARDLLVLSDQGYKVRDVQPFDMFPQTDHVECVARLTLPSSARR